MSCNYLELPFHGVQRPLLTSEGRRKACRHICKYIHLRIKKDKSLKKSLGSRSFGDMMVTGSLANMADKSVP